MIRLFSASVLALLCTCSAAQDLAMLKAELSKTLVATPVERPAVLTIKVWDTKPCEPGMIAETEIVQHLAKKRWRYGKHYEVLRSDDGPCPQFFYGGKELCADGWDGWEKFNEELSAAMGVGRTSVSPPPTAPVAVEFSTWNIPLEPGARITHVNGVPVEQLERSVGIPPARRRWYHNGHSASADHLRFHGIDPTGMTQAEMDRAHSHAHEGTWNPAWAPSGTNYVRAAQPQSGCPSGMCPR